MSKTSSQTGRAECEPLAFPSCTLFSQIKPQWFWGAEAETKKLPENSPLWLISCLYPDIYGIPESLSWTEDPNKDFLKVPPNNCYLPILGRPRYIANHHVRPLEISSLLWIHVNKHWNFLFGQREMVHMRKKIWHLAERFIADIFIWLLWRENSQAVAVNSQHTEVNMLQ